MNEKQGYILKLLGEVNKHLTSDYKVSLIGDDTLHIITPHVYNDFSNIEVYLSDEGDGKFTLSDDGETCNRLFIDGHAIEESPAKMYRAQILAGIHGVDFESSVFSMPVLLQTMGRTIHRLCSVISDVSAMGEGGKIG